jgi:hypothetical protein
VSLFNRTPTGLTQSDVKALDAAMTTIFDALRNRLQGMDAEIAELKKEVAGLKKMPRQSLQQKLKNK